MHTWIKSQNWLVRKGPPKGSHDTELHPNGSAISPVGRLHNIDGQSVPVLGPCTVKDSFLIQVEHSVCYFLPIHPCPLLWHHQAEPGSIILTPFLQTVVCIDEVPTQLSLLKAKQAQLSQPFPINTWSSLLIIAALWWTCSSSSMSFTHWGSQNQMQSPRYAFCGWDWGDMWMHVCMSVVCIFMYIYMLVSL